jgi:threonyl-tRNA synthetase
MDNKEQLNNLRHSVAHLLAAAVMELWPDTKRTIGPAIDNGFYFDFEFKKPISESDFPAIEKKMRELLPSWTSFERHELSAEEAKKEYPHNEYKHELIDQFSQEGQVLTFYKSGNYWDLCRGGHCDHPEKEMQHFKLLSVAGAYWRGDENNTMLTRIYGTAFPSAEELQQYLDMQEEAKKRDHRKIGKELDLFVFSDLVGAGLPLFTPRGTIIRRELETYIGTLREAQGFQKVWIPHIAKTDLYKTSGHWDKFEDDLFHVKSKKTESGFVLKPMNCPHHAQIFAAGKRSYREMPVRYAETTTIYRDENTGQLQGLTRVRSITQDDSHVFCRVDQIQQEFDIAYSLITTLYSVIGMDLKVRLSTHDPKQPEKYLGSPEVWSRMENELQAMLKAKGRAFEVGEGEAAFYGPKLDFMGVDSLGREWQLATIQVDFNQPERFQLAFTNEKNEDERPVMIHVAVMGSTERFMGVLIEHYAGNFPVWLSPVQVILLPVSDTFNPAAEKLAADWRQLGIRVDVDTNAETLGNKIRKASALKIPYQIAFGQKEADGADLQVRVRGQEKQTMIKAELFQVAVQKIISERLLDLSL